MKKYLFAIAVASSIFAPHTFAQEVLDNGKSEFDRQRPGHEQRFEKRMEKLVEACSNKNTQEPCSVSVGDKEVTGTCTEMKRDHKMICKIDRQAFGDRRKEIDGEFKQRRMRTLESQQE